MKDTQALAFLLKAQGDVANRHAQAAAELGVSGACLSMWLKRRAIPNLMRFHVLEVLNKRGAKLPTDWAKPRLNGGANGGKSRTKGAKRKKTQRARKARPQQRRSAKRGDRSLVGKGRNGAGRRRASSEAAQVA